MKTVLLSIVTLSLLTFSFVGNNDSKGGYIIPKDPVKAAAIINQAFATPFASLKFKVVPKNIYYANASELEKLILSNSNIPKENRIQLIKEIGSLTDVQATIIDFDGLNLCEGESNFTMIVEAGSVGTRVAFVYSTCGIFRCVLAGYTPQNGYTCNKGVGPIKTVQLCTESSALCCVYYYCPGSECPNATCMVKNDCVNCD